VACTCELDRTKHYVIGYEADAAMAIRGPGGRAPYDIWKKRQTASKYRHSFHDDRPFPARHERFGSGIAGLAAWRRRREMR
jgi:hypothetical protein